MLKSINDTNLKVDYNKRAVNKNEHENDNFYPIEPPKDYYDDDLNVNALIINDENIKQFNIQSNISFTSHDENKFGKITNVIDTVASSSCKVKNVKSETDMNEQQIQKSITD